MKKEARDFLNAEMDYFKKLAELQFTHFMQVFIFWTAVVTAPISARLLVAESTSSSNTNLSILLVGIAGIGWFVASKMFDIRCSQLKYISALNYVREQLYEEVKKELPFYIHQFPPIDLRKEAFKDFGIWMAITMSLIHGVYIWIGSYILLLNQNNINKCYSLYIPSFLFVFFFVFGVGTYCRLINKRVKTP